MRTVEFFDRLYRWWNRVHCQSTYRRCFTDLRELTIHRAIVFSLAEVHFLTVKIDAVRNPSDREFPVDGEGPLEKKVMPISRPFPIGIK